MFLSVFELSESLGVTPAELIGGGTWQLPGDGGKHVTAQIARDTDDNSISATAVEGVPGQDSQVIAVVSAMPIEDGFEVTGTDMTGETSNPDDPRCAAAAFRRQIQAILSSLGGRKVA